MSDATEIVRGLMHGPGSREYGHVEAAMRAAQAADHRDERLAA